MEARSGNNARGGAPEAALDDPLLMWTTVDFHDYSTNEYNSPVPVNLGAETFPEMLYHGNASSGSASRATSVAKADAPAQTQKRRTEDLLADDDPDQEERRRRNSAASARFRQKKKMREQKLETLTKIMSEKTEVLQRRVRVLETEVKYLRDLLTLRQDREREAEITGRADAAAQENSRLAAIEPPMPLPLD